MNKLISFVFIFRSLEGRAVALNIGFSGRFVLCQAFLGDQRVSNRLESRSVDLENLLDFLCICVSSCYESLLTCAVGVGA